MAMKAQSLTDLELAILLCLAAEQHCIIETDEEAIDRVARELELRDGHARNRGADDDDDDDDDGDHDAPTPDPDPDDGRCLPHVVIAKRLDRADNEVQIQALELLRTKHLPTRAGLRSTPAPFLLVPLLVTSRAEDRRLSPHLLDYIFLSHYHSADDDFRHLDEAEQEAHVSDEDSDDNDDDDDDDDSPSVVRKSAIHGADRARPPPPTTPVFSSQDLSHLRTESHHTTITLEVLRYLHDIAVFLRMHRAVDGGGGGVSARATKHLALLAKGLAALHGVSFVTPSLVALAAKKVFPHRIRITKPRDERSMQWGSRLPAVEALLRGVTPVLVVEQVLRAVEVPV
ncbi:MAG: hypothetical protein M1826_004732 [Phylliscum demangeonii]|nr:MAG: hypothetical protein M1826_004732 [Phylliscum demangeonii]